MTFAVNSCTPKCKNLPYTPRSYESLESLKSPESPESHEIHENRVGCQEIYFWVFVLFLVLYYLRTKLG
jgi:hypothetical protein